MTRLRFVKMEGAGNDYVYLDGIAQPIAVETAAALARPLSDRHLGVGGDGLILLLPSEVADCRMVMWNADGSRGRMCGNGLRCAAKLARDAGHVRGTTLEVETDSGVRRAELLLEGAEVVGARVDMGSPSMAAAPRRLEVAGRGWEFLLVDAGSPHAVAFVDEEPDALPLEAVGTALQAAFPGGVNVELARVQPDGSLRQRTFERGSGETLACGSGATAVAFAALETGRVHGPTVAVRLRGGTLIVQREGSALVMEGPARTVFSGEIEVSPPN